MKARLLFPSFLRPIGFILFVPGFIFGYITVYQNYLILDVALAKIGINPPLPLSATIELALVIIGLMLIAFSKSKNEDELTGKIRLNALYWSILANYGLLCVMGIWNYFAPKESDLVSLFNYRHDITIYNYFTPAIIFIILFYYFLYRRKNEFTIKNVRYLPYKPFHLIGIWLSVAIIVLLIISRILPLLNDLFSYLFPFLPFGLLIWVYSKEKTEDEYIDSVRLEAMQIAVLVNYIILLISDFCFYNFDFVWVGILNLATIPLIFIVWFQFRLYIPKNKNEVKPTLS